METPLGRRRTDRRRRRLFGDIIESDSPDTFQFGSGISPLPALPPPSDEEKQGRRIGIPPFDPRDKPPTRNQPPTRTQPRIEPGEEVPFEPSARGGSKSPFYSDSEWESAKNWYRNVVNNEAERQEMKDMFDRAEGFANEFNAPTRSPVSGFLSDEPSFLESQIPEFEMGIAEQIPRTPVFEEALNSVGNLISRAGRFVSNKVAGAGTALEEGEIGTALVEGAEAGAGLLAVAL